MSLTKQDILKFCAKNVRRFGVASHCSYDVTENGTDKFILSVHDGSTDERIFREWLKKFGYVLRLSDFKIWPYFGVSWRASIYPKRRRI